MLDVIFYRRDRRGRLRLKERLFRSIDEVGRHFLDDERCIWEWAEITPIRRRGTGVSGRTVHYTAKQLRSIGRRHVGPWAN